MILPPSGSLTRRSPPGVQASIRASGTRAHTRAVQSAGTVSVCGLDSAPLPSPAGTARGVADCPAGTWAAGATGDPDDADADDDGAAVPCPWPGDSEHAAAAAITIAASSATVKPRYGTVMGSPPI